MARTTQTIATRTGKGAIIAVSEELDGAGRHSIFTISISGPKDGEHTERSISRDELVHFKACIEFMLSGHYSKFVPLEERKGELNG